MSALQLAGAYRLSVRRLGEPGCLWCWEIRDETDGLVLSCWEHEWGAYESRHEAEAVGEARVRHVAADRLPEPVRPGDCRLPATTLV